MAILWTKSKKPIPWEYYELILCRDVYHCTPKELYEQDLDIILMHMELMSVEQKIKDFNNQESIGSKKRGR